MAAGDPDTDSDPDDDDHDRAVPDPDPYAWRGWPPLSGAFAGAYSDVLNACADTDRPATWGPDWAWCLRDSLRAWSRAA